MLAHSFCQNSKAGGEALEPETRVGAHLQEGHGWDTDAWIRSKGSTLGSKAEGATYPVHKVQAAGHHRNLEVADRRGPLEVHHHMVHSEFQTGVPQHWGIHRALQGQDLHNHRQGGIHCHTGPHHGEVQGSSHLGVLQVPVLQLRGNSARRTGMVRVVKEAIALYSY